MRFAVDGERLTLSDALNRLSHVDESMRRAAAMAIGAGLGERIELFALITNTLVKDKEIDDRWRHYPTPVSYRNLANYVEDHVVEALAEAVRSASERLGHRYYRLKARWFGKEALDYWDRNAPLPDAVERCYGWQEARQTVLDAFAAFSPPMADLASAFFDNGWIDAAPRPGKDSGAFAHSTVPSAHPYILMNFYGRPRRVTTLAHELGHGVHQRLAARQGLLMSHTPLTLAETASVFGEMLVFRALKDAERDPRRALALICGKIEESCSTVFRQVVLTRFEQALHDARRREGELPIERINTLWLDANRAMFGDSVTLTADYARWWSYIPHFVHTPFYCYAYAFGALLVFALYRKYLDEGEAFVPKYLALLSAGGSEAPERLLAPLGIDLGAPGFWDGGITVLESWVDEAETLAETLLGSRRAPSPRGTRSAARARGR
jgi:oligoendopeptidase F